MVGSMSDSIIFTGLGEGMSNIESGVRYADRCALKVIPIAMRFLRGWYCLERSGLLQVEMIANRKHQLTVADLFIIYDRLSVSPRPARR
jgi:hypothetical protein